MRLTRWGFTEPVALASPSHTVIWENHSVRLLLLWWNKDVSRSKEQRRRAVCPICIQRYVACHYETEKEKLSSAKYWDLWRNVPLSPKLCNDGLQRWVDRSSVENSVSTSRTADIRILPVKISSRTAGVVREVNETDGSEKKPNIPWWPILLLLYVRRLLSCGAPGVLHTDSLHNGALQSWF